MVAFTQPHVQKEQSLAEIRRLNEGHPDGLSRLYMSRLHDQYERADGAAQARGKPQRQEEPDWLSMIPEGTPAHARLQPSYVKDFAKYIAGANGERLGLVAADDSRGGYMAATTFAAQVSKKLDETVSVRSLATVLRYPDAVTIDVPGWETDFSDAVWGAEVPTSDLAEDTGARFSGRELTPHLMTKFFKTSRRLVRSGMLGLLDFFADRLAYCLNRTEEAAFLTGHGAGRPLGVFVASSEGIPTSRDFTCSSATAFVGDDLVNGFYALKEAYQGGATWIGCREFARRARVLKDSNGQYLWVVGTPGSPDTILGRPIRQSEQAPSTFTTGLYIGIVGDFRAGYWIGESLNLEIQRLDQLFALKNQVGWIARREVDGQPVVAEAFSRLKLA